MENGSGLKREMFWRYSKEYTSKENADYLKS